MPRDLTSAFSRGRKGSYGTCRSCGKPIRLTASENEDGTLVIRARCCPRPEKTQ
ncbi:hypothetical protein [Streptomyces diacarni]|uniref:hypothetical protein n=1 Tax=Streptomyces diacarni TaxID=2800381 RepID=UPI0015F0CACF|nr:hypothetical protein [Streptomyces diacarni]